MNLRHTVSPDSRFHEISAEILRKADARLILSIQAHDPAISADVRAVHTYTVATILPRHRFQDAVTIDEHGNTTADLTKLSLVQPISDP